ILGALVQKGADMNTADRHGLCPLHVLSVASTQMVPMLVAAGARTDARDDQGDTPLHKFINHPAMVKMLLDCRANPNVPNSIGLTPFQIALADEHIEKFPHVLPLFLSSSADFNTPS